MAEDYVKQIERARRQVTQSQALVCEARELISLARTTRADGRRLRSGLSDPAANPRLGGSPNLELAAGSLSPERRRRPSTRAARDWDLNRRPSARVACARQISSRASQTSACDCVACR